VKIPVLKRRNKVKVFTKEELKQYDGSQQGKPIYFAYKGKVYDITASPLFLDGLHFEHYAGMDLTDYMADAPHKDEVLEKLRVVGNYKEE
jgi:predicted heme/steroid binding protein